MDNLNSTFFPLLYSAIGILFLRGVYKTFMVKPDTAMDYMTKANYLTSFYKMRGLAIKTLQEALNRFDNLSEEEKSFINFQIGVNYYYKKKYEKAIEYFEVAWPYLKKAKIPYNKIYASIVVAYYDVGEKEKAREMYHYLKNKEKYDPRFGALSYLENSIFK